MHRLPLLFGFLLLSVLAKAQTAKPVPPTASVRSYALASTPVTFGAAPAFSCPIITGRILNQNQQGLVGATVAIKGTYDVFTTNSEGSFVVNTPVTGTQVLMVSAAGYSEKQIRLLSCDTFTISLEPLAGTRIKQRGKLKGTIKKVGH